MEQQPNKKHCLPGEHSGWIFQIKIQIWPTGGLWMLDLKSWFARNMVPSKCSSCAVSSETADCILQFIILNVIMNQCCVCSCIHVYLLCLRLFCLFLAHSFPCYFLSVDKLDWQKLAAEKQRHHKSGIPLTKIFLHSVTNVQIFHSVPFPLLNEFKVIEQYCFTTSNKCVFSISFVATVFSFDFLDHCDAFAAGVLRATECNKKTPWLQVTSPPSKEILCRVIFPLSWKRQKPALTWWI